MGVNAKQSARIARSCLPCSLLAVRRVGWTSAILSSHGVVGRDVSRELAGVDRRMAAPVWRTTFGQGSLLERSSYLLTRKVFVCKNACHVAPACRRKQLRA